MALSDSDLFACSRGGQNYNVTAKQIKEYADKRITAEYVECFGNLVTRGDLFLTSNSFDEATARAAIFNNYGNAFFCDNRAGVDINGEIYAQDFRTVSGPQPRTIDPVTGAVTVDMTNTVSLMDLINNLTTRIEQLEADHASAMNNMEDDNGSSTY